MKLSALSSFILSTLLGLVVVFVIDPMDASTLSTPFLLGIILMYLSLRQKAWLILSIVIVYCLLDFYATDVFMGNFRLPARHPYFWFFQRFGLFFVVCVMAVYLSYHREESEKNLQHIQSILGKLPAPVVISDATGYIVYVNEALCAFFSQPDAKLIGQRYLDLFMANIEEGKAMRYYIELFGADAQNEREVDLVTSASSASVKAGLTCLGVGRHRNMITVLKPKYAERD